MEGWKRNLRDPNNDNNKPKLQEASWWMDNIKEKGGLRWGYKGYRGWIIYNDSLFY